MNYFTQQTSPNGLTPQMAPLQVQQAAVADQAAAIAAGGAAPNPLAEATSGFFQSPDGSFNLQNLGIALGGIRSIGSIWNAYQQNKIAKESLALQREAYDTNLANQTQTYNTALEDRIRARHTTEGRSSAETDSYLSKHSL